MPAPATPPDKPGQARPQHPGSGWRWYAGWTVALAVALALTVVWCIVLIWLVGRLATLLGL